MKLSQVVLLRMGNQSTNNVLETVIKHREAIEGLYRSSEFGVLNSSKTRRGSPMGCLSASGSCYHYM